MKTKKLQKRGLAILGVLSLSLTNSFAQTGHTALGKFMNETPAEQQVLLFTIFALVFLLIVLSLVLLVEVAIVRQVLTQKFKKTADEAVTEQAESSSFAKWFWEKFNAASSTKREADIMLDHDYDGIHELDNDLPPWWKYGFYLTIVLGVFYIWRYHIAWDDVDPVSVREYKTAMIEADQAKKAYLAKVANAIDETNVEITTIDSEIAAGQKIYDQNCKACHGGQGEGGVGPNMTDAYWLHGGDVKDIFKTIKYGVPVNGMLPWQDKLRPQEMQQVASFILTLQGTNPPNAKEPQGELYENESN